MAETNSKTDDKKGDEKKDECMDNLISAMAKMEPADKTQEKTIEQELEELSRHPAFMTEFDPSKPMSSDMEALMQLKYESEDPTAGAEAYKEDGNHEFKKKKYRIAVDNYTEGIKCRSPDRTLNAILYTNRAAAQYHIGNYRTSFNDCLFARKFKPDHMKAIHRGAMCCLEMKKYEDAVRWCDDGLAIEPTDSKLLEIRQKAVKEQKAVERDKRKEQLQNRKMLSGDMKLMKAIQDRGMKLGGMRHSGDKKEPHTGLLTSLETHNPAGSKVQIDAKNVLYWPVMFLYPEHTETDFIEMFCENHRLIDHLSHIFGVEAEPPPWDKERRYKPYILNVYFEDKEKEKLIKVKKESSLLKVLQHERYVIYGGTPAFIITVAGSPFETAFLQRYS